MSTITAYKMNPATDRIVFGDELRDGMLVIREDAHMRCASAASEDEQIRMNHFCKVTRLRTVDRGSGPCAAFIGEWVDGYQKAFGPIHHMFAWIVRREDVPDAEAELLAAPEVTSGDPQ